MIIPKIKTEVGVVIVIMIALLTGIFTVVGFDKISRDLDKIQAATDANQAALNDIIKDKSKK